MTIAESVGARLWAAQLRHSQELMRLEARLRTYRGFFSEPSIRREEALLRALKGFRLRGFEGWGYGDPPRLRRLYPPRPVMPGATTDWDFSKTTWALDTAVYVSAPSSWRVTYDFVHGVCKYAGTTNLTQGRIVSSVRSTHTNGFWYFQCRDQTPDGGPVSGNRYRFSLPCSAAYTWAVYEGGATLASGTTYLTGDFSVNTWYDVQVTWWTDAGNLILRAETDSSKLFNDVVDTSPSWGATGTAKEAVGGWAQAALRSIWHDDTEIWGP